MLIELQHIAVAEAIKADGSSHWNSGKKLGFSSEFYNMSWLVELGIIIVEHRKTKEHTVTTVANCRELKPIYKDSKESKMNPQLLKLIAQASRPDFEHDIIMNQLDIMTNKVETIIKLISRSEKTKLMISKKGNPLT